MLTQSPFSSIAALREKHLELLKRHRERPDDRTLLDVAEAFIQSACRTGLVLDSEADRDEAQRIIDTWATRLYRAGREVDESTLAEFDETLAPEPTGRPYVGLNAFSEGDRKFFCGRDSLVAELLERLKTSNLVALVGPSGSGKSSLMLAGVAPALQGGTLPGSERWLQSGRIVPGSDPLRNLAGALARASGQDRNWEDQQIDLMRRNPNSLSDLLTSLCDAGSVLMIDQFEEVFTLCQSETDRLAFDLNLAATVQSSTRHIVLLTMRDDYLGYLRMVPRMQPLIDKAMRVPGTLTEEELKDAIQRPAEMVGLRFDDGVVDALVADLKGVASALPLLQFSLLQLWDRRSRNRLTMNAYREIGGGKLGLAKVADEFFENSLAGEEQEIAKRIFMWLVKPGQGMVEFVSRRVRKNDLYQIAAPQIVDPILEKLEAARLIKFTEPESVDDTEVEVAHEALIRNWGLLGEWLSKAREELSMKQRLELRASDWVRQSRQAGLLDELSLREFEQWLATPEAQMLGSSTAAKDLIAASQKEVERKFRRERRIRWAWTLGCAGGVLLAAVALFFARAASRQRNEANSNARAANELRDLSVYNYNEKKKDYDDLQTALRQLQQKEDDLVAKNKENFALANRYHATEFSDAAKVASDSNPDVGALLALYANSFTWDTEHTVLDPVLVALRNATAGMRTEMVLRLDQPDRLSNAAAVAPVAFSTDGAMLAGADSDGSIHLWDAYTGTELAPLKGPRKVGALAFCPDNKCLGAAEPDGAHLWNLDTRHETVLSRGKAVSSLAFSPDGKYKATGEDGQIRLWDASGKEVWKLPKAGVVSAVAFSLDATLLAAGSGDGSVSIWRTLPGEFPLEKNLNAPRTNPVPSNSSATGSPSPPQAGQPPPPSSPPPEKVKVTALQFTRDGYLTAGSSQGLLTRWRLPDFAEEARPSFDPDRPFNTDGTPIGAVLAIHRDGGFLRSQQRVLLASTGGSFSYPTSLNGHTSTIFGAAFSPSGNRLASSSADGTIRIWTNRNSIYSSQYLSWVEGSPAAADFTSDGKFLAVLALQSCAEYDAQSRRQLVKFSCPARNSIALSADGKTIALAGTGVSLVVPGNPSRNRVLDPGAQYSSVAISSEGGKVVAGNSKALKYWDTASGRAANWEIPALAVAMSYGDGRWIAAGGDDGTVSLVSPGQRGPRTLKTYQGRVRSLAFDPKVQWLASAGNDRTIHLSSLSGSPDKTLTGITEPVDKVVFSEDGRQLAAITTAGSVSFWDVSTGTRIRTVSRALGFSAVRAVAFVRDGPALLTVNSSGSVNRITIDGSDVVETAFNRLVRSWSEADCEAQFQQPCPPRLGAISSIVKANGEVRDGNLAAAQASVGEAFKVDPNLAIDPKTYVRHLADTLTDQISSQRSADLSYAGQMAAWAGDLSDAAKYYGEAPKLQPGATGSPAKRAASALVSQAYTAVASRYTTTPYRVVEAWIDVQRARQLDPANKAFSANDLNEICWTGSLNRFAAEVKGACEEAAESKPTNFQMVDSRGLNRALLGDYPGAIKDFEYFVQVSQDPKAKAQRQKYIDALRQKKNPFDEKELRDII